LKEEIKKLYLEWKELNPTGEIFNRKEEYFLKQINKILKTFDENPTTTHAFRYTVISRLAHEYSPKIVAEWIGHASVSTTYRYLLPTLTDEERKKMAEKVLN
jgi:integrase